VDQKKEFFLEMSAGFLLIIIILYANSGGISIGNVGSHPRDVELDSINKLEKNLLTVGNKSSFFPEINTTLFVSGRFETIGGMSTRATQYGNAFSAHNFDDKILYSDMSGNGVFLSIGDLICDFVSNPFNSSLNQAFLTIISANVSNSSFSYDEATGYLVSVLNSSCLKINTGAGGDTTLYDANDVKFIIFDQPLFSILDSGTIHYKLGGSDESEIRYNIPEGKSARAMYFDDNSAADDHDTIQMEYHANTFSPGSAITFDYFSGNMQMAKSAAVLDMQLFHENSTGGVIFGLRVSTDKDNGLNITAVETENYVNPLNQHIGEYNGTNATVFRSENGIVDNITSEVLNESVSSIVFVNDNDKIYIGSDSLFGDVFFIFSTVANQPIIPSFFYSSGPSTWTKFQPIDGTNQFVNDGKLRFNPELLLGWSNSTFNGTSKYWIRIDRERNNLVVPPAIKTIKILSIDEVRDYWWDSLGNVNINSLTLSNFITGSNTGISLCIDANDKVCICGYCA